MVGSFNGDGLLDVATAPLLSNSISVLLGYSNGTFRAAPESLRDQRPGLYLPRLRPLPPATSTATAGPTW